MSPNPRDYIKRSILTYLVLLFASSIGTSSAEQPIFSVPPSAPAGTRLVVFEGFYRPT
jgi:hypothetical protein